MPRRKKPQLHVRFCDATGLPILCVKCHRTARLPRDKESVCDLHRAIVDYMRIDNITDQNPFNLPQFIEKISWEKVITSCQPELAMLFQGFKRINSDIARRVV